MPSEPFCPLVAYLSAMLNWNPYSGELGKETTAVFGNDSALELKALVITLRIALHLGIVLSIEQTVLHRPMSLDASIRTCDVTIPTPSHSEGLFEGTGTSDRVPTSKYDL